MIPLGTRLTVDSLTRSYYYLYPLLPYTCKLLTATPLATLR